MLRRKKYRRRKLGDLVVVHCLDHLTYNGGTSGPIPISVVGWVVEETKKYIILDSWKVPEAEWNSSNRVSFTVVKHPGLKIHRAKEYQ